MMNIAEQLPDALTTPLENIDVSDERLYEQDAWRPYFERLRNEDPVHYQANSPFGPFWSVTRFEDILAVDCLTTSIFRGNKWETVDNNGCLTDSMHQLFNENNERKS